MKSSDSATSVLLQSTSLAGIEEDSKAVLRRWVSRWLRAATLARMAFATFSAMVLAFAFSPRGGVMSHEPISLATTWDTIREAAGVPKTSLV